MKETEYNYIMWWKYPNQAKWTAIGFDTKEDYEFYRKTWGETKMEQIFTRRIEL